MGDGLFGRNLYYSQGFLLFTIFYLGIGVLPICAAVILSGCSNKIKWAHDNKSLSELRPDLIACIDEANRWNDVKYDFGQDNCILNEDKKTPTLKCESLEALRWVKVCMRGNGWLDKKHKRFRKLINNLFNHYVTPTSEQKIAWGKNISALNGCTNTNDVTYAASDEIKQVYKVRCEGKTLIVTCDFNGKIYEKSLRGRKVPYKLSKAGWHTVACWI